MGSCLSTHLCCINYRHLLPTKGRPYSLLTSHKTNTSFARYCFLTSSDSITRTINMGSGILGLGISGLGPTNKLTQIQTSYGRHPWSIARSASFENMLGNYSKAIHSLPVARLKARRSYQLANQDAPF